MVARAETSLTGIMMRWKMKILPYYSKSIKVDAIARVLLYIPEAIEGLLHDLQSYVDNRNGVWVELKIDKCGGGDSAKISFLVEIECLCPIL